MARWAVYSKDSQTIDSTALLAQSSARASIIFPLPPFSPAAILSPLRIPAAAHPSLPEHRRYTGRRRNGGHGEPSLCGLRNDDNGHHNSAIGGGGKDGCLVGKIRVFFRQFPVSRKHHVVARMRPLCCRTTWVIVTKRHRCWAVATAAASLIVTGCTNIRGTRDSYKEVAESFR